MTTPRRRWLPRYSLTFLLACFAFGSTSMWFAQSFRDYLTERMLIQALVRSVSHVPM